MKNVSVLILSKDKAFSDSLKDHLVHNPVCSQISIGSYEDVDKCLQNLSLQDEEDVIVLNYNERLANELSQKTNELLRDFTLIHYLPENIDEHKAHFVKSGVKEHAVAGTNSFRQITNLLKRIIRKNKVERGFANVNYVIAGFTLLITIILAVYLLSN